MCTFFERKNQDKSVTRLGQADIGTYDTEKLLMLNSYARSVGYVNDLPFPTATAPTLTPNAAKEYMGFSYHLPEKLHKVCNPVNGTEAGTVYSDDEEALMGKRNRSRSPKPKHRTLSIFLETNMMLR